jgi:hypothetical protein
MICCRIPWIAAVLLGILLLCSVAESKPRGRRTPRAPLQQPPTAARPLYQQESNPSLRQANPSAYWRDIYPQFYGGFHYRQIYEFGPPGDFGFRGSPW